MTKQWQLLSRERGDGQLLRVGAAASGFDVLAPASAGNGRVGVKGQDGAYTKNNGREKCV